MKLHLDDTSKTPIFQQVVDQVHFAINTGELAPGDKLPSIRSLASENNLAANTVAKALRQLEFRGVLQAKDRSGYVVADSPSSSRYQARGVSADKGEVHRVVDNLDDGIFPNAFCHVTEDYLGGDPERCNVIHADGSGTKSIIAYLHYKETGDASVFHGIAQDSIVMNLDDLLCIGTNGRIVISNTINRNALNCPGEVIAALIDGSEQFLAELRQFGVNIYSGGGETADVGDLTGTVVVDSCAVSVLKKSDVITGDQIGPDLAIVGLSSTGKGSYETTDNSGIGSNGLTSARHELLHHAYAESYPESFDPNVSADLIYCGPYKLSDPLPHSSLTVGQALLSPTRTYAPVIYEVLRNYRDAVRGLVHCSGGAQTKCLKFGNGIHFVKNNLFPAPAIFKAIQAASGTEPKEMYQVFNMGHRMEIYCEESSVAAMIEIANSFDIEAQQIGFTQANKAQANNTAGNHLTIVHGDTTIEY